MQGPARRYLLGSLVYASAALLLVCLAVFAGSFSQTVGAARISGRFSPFPLFNRSRLEALTLSWNGLDLSFSRGSSPGLARLETGNGTADIVLGDNERLRLSSPDGAGSTLTLSQVSGGAATGDVLRMPFRVSGVLQAGPGMDTIAWTQGAGSYQLSLPSNATVDYETRLISLPLAASSPASEIRFVSLSPKAARELELQASAAVPRLPEEKLLPTQDQLNELLARWADSAYTGWSASRYSAGLGTWKMADGKQGFSENIGTGLLAEALARGTFSSALNTWANAEDNQLSRSPSPQLSFATCVYTGRVKDFAARPGDAAELERLKGLAAQGDASLAATPGVLLFALDRGGLSTARTILSSLRSLDSAKLPASSLLTVLESLEDYAQFVGNDATVLSDARTLVTDRLLPSLAATGGAVFLAGPGGSVDVRQSIRCGSLLIRAGSLLQSSQFSALGRGLIVSSLSLASKEGFLPATLTVASGRTAPAAGTIGPESVYAMLPMGRHIPHEVPLFQLMGPGCWVWTAADLVSASQINGEVRLVFAYPAGVAQYLVFRGLPPFKQIRLHGIPWHADSSYAKYSDGWNYNADSRTLFMKVTGKQSTEEVDFTF
jgi:hypothetical protein